MDLETYKKTNCKVCKVIHLVSVVETTALQKIFYICFKFQQKFKKTYVSDFDSWICSFYLCKNI